MTPILPIDDSIYRASAYSMLRSDGLTGFARSDAPPNVSYIVLGQNRACCGFASKSRASSFGIPIMHVVGTSAKKKMAGINALGIVAFMAYLQAVWYRAICQFVAEAMRLIFAAINRKPSISPSACSLLPFPAFTLSACIYLAPEPLSWIGVIGNAQPVVMAFYKAMWVVRNGAVAIVSELGNWRVLPTSTLAFAIGREQSTLRYPRSIIGYVFGKGWGMIHDVNSSFRLLTTPPSDSRRCGGNFIRELNYTIGVA